MNRHSKLFKNSIIFAIGNLGSKLISFILVPFYTFVLTKSEFGTVDLISTTVNLFAPIITISIFDAVFRFTLEKDEEKNEILSNGIVVSIFGSVLAILFLPILALFKIPFSNYLILLLISTVFLSLLSNFARANGQVKVFAFSGIIGTIATAGLSIILLSFLNLGIRGYLLALLFSNIITIIFLSYMTRISSRFRLKYVNLELLKKMLVYSIPLIPNAFSWWINTSADRFFILAFVGAAANGIYAVASKIPSLLTLINQIFFQSWQMSAVEEYNSGDASDFYSNVFNAYLTLQFICATIILLVLKPLMGILVAESYFVSWKYIPFLLLAVIYSSISGFLGTTYTAAKKTTAILFTTLVGAILNIIMGFVLVPFFGIQGASLASGFSFGVVALIRLINTKQFLVINVNWVKVCIYHVQFIVMTTLLFVLKEVVYLEVALAILVIIGILINVKELKQIVDNIKKNR